MSRKTLILFVWLIIGAAAAGQRGYFSNAVDLQRGGNDRGDDGDRAAQLPRRQSADHLQLALALVELSRSGYLVAPAARPASRIRQEVVER